MPVEQDQQRGRTEEHHHRRGHLDDPAPGEGPYLLYVARQPRDELARFHPVVVAETQALDLGEEIVPQVVGHPLRRPLGQIPLQEGEQPPQQGRRREPAHREQDDVQPPRGYALVYGDPDQLRRRQARRRGKQQRHEREGRLALVGAQVE